MEGTNKWGEDSHEDGNLNKVTGMTSVSSRQKSLLFSPFPLLFLRVVVVVVVLIMYVYDAHVCKCVQVHTETIDV